MLANDFILLVLVLFVAVGGALFLAAKKNAFRASGLKGAKNQGKKEKSVGLTAETMRKHWTNSVVQVGDDAFTKLIHVKPKTKSKQRIVLLIVPGNPGSPEFYKDFAHTIFEESQRAVEIFILGHTAHSTGGHNGSRVFNLKDQVKHKIHFVQQLIRKDPNVRLFLAGHSVGAYICLQILRAIPKENVLRAFLLMPTIMHIRNTPNGHRMHRMFYRPLRPLLCSLVYLGSLMPKKMVRPLLKLNLGNDASLLDSVFDLLDHRVVNNALHMAGTEMEEILDLDHHIVKEHASKLTMYFSPADDWCPIDFYHKIKEQYSADVHLELCRDGLLHAFVIGGSHLMGKKVAKWMKQTIEQQKQQQKQS